MTHTTNTNTTPLLLLLLQLRIRFLFLFLFFAATIATIAAFDFECPNSKTPPLVVRGKHFYDASKDAFVPIKGIAYYPRPNAGPLAESNSVDFYTDDYAPRWRADVANLRDLGVNAIRLYAVDPSRDHDAFFCALQEAGIYALIGLLADCEDCGIGAYVGVDAEPPSCYTQTVKDRGKYVIRTFSRYDNVMAFSAGNEVSIYADDGDGGAREVNVPCQKKFLRDMREYASGCSGGSGMPLSRAVPIGLVNWDNPQTIEQHVYYHCHTDPDDAFESTEWFALNSYRHCDGAIDSPSDIVGWQELQTFFERANFPTPVMLGEYGCREYGFPTMGAFEAQRTWLQSEALYNLQDYSDVFAGGFVFEYSAEKKVVDVNLQFMADRNSNGIPKSEWPYEKMAKVNYGIGYFGPVDCQHNYGSNGGSGESTSESTSVSTAAPPCEYTKYPEWDGLANVYASVKSSIVNANANTRLGTVPACPERFPPLASFEWPTDDDEDPDLEYCRELQRNNKITDAPTATPTAIPTATATLTAATGTPTTAPETEDESESESSSSSSSSSTPEADEAEATEAPTGGATTSESLDLSSVSMSSTVESIASTTSAPTTTATLPPTTLSPSFFPTPILTRRDDNDNNDIVTTTTTPPTTITISPTLPPPISLPPTTITTMSPSSSPTTTLTTDVTDTDTDTGLCSVHPKCYAQNLTGSCCPTIDGIELGCCESFGDNLASASASARPLVPARGDYSFYYHHLFAVSVSSLVAAVLAVA